MNKFNRATFPVIHVVRSACRRGLSILRGEKYQVNPGPQWQQLELPFSRTPVRKWNR